LATLLRKIRVWPLEPRVARTFAIIAQELRSRGRVLSQVDMMLAALARQMGLTILSTDTDFDALPDIRRENWL